MNRYKAFLTTALLLAALAVLSACGGAKDNPEGQPTEPAAAEAAAPPTASPTAAPSAAGVKIVDTSPGHGSEDGNNSVITAGSGIDDAGKITLGTGFTGVLPGGRDDWYRFNTSAVAGDSILIRLTNLSPGTGRLFLRLYDESNFNLMHLKAADDGTAVTYTANNLDPSTAYYVKLTSDSRKDPVNYKLTFISVGGYDEAVIRIKNSITEDLREAMAGDTSGTTLSEDGELTMANDVLFDESEYELKSEGKAALDAFCRTYLPILLSDDYIDSLDSINFEGHADPNGDPALNEELSLNRAKSVLDYCLQSSSSGLTEAQKQLLEKKAAVAGYGSNEPIKGPDGQVDYAASRRVEVSFVIVIPTD